MGEWKKAPRILKLGTRWTVCAEAADLAPKLVLEWERREESLYPREI
jgi:hypothetical protein